MSALSAYGQAHADDFGGLYFDQAPGNKVVVLFTDNIEEHERALQELTPANLAVEVRQVQYTHAELLSVLDELATMHGDFSAAGIEMLSSGLDVVENEVVLEAKSDDPTAEASIEALFPGMLDATIYPLPGPWSHVESGDGWRLLAAGATGPQRAFSVHAATDAAAAGALWEAAALDGAASGVDWEREIVVAFIHGMSRGCPELRLDAVVIDDTQGVVYATTSDPLAPRGCRMDLSAAYTFVVALDRAALPQSPFALQLHERSQSCPDCPFPEVIEVSIP